MNYFKFCCCSTLHYESTTHLSSIKISHNIKLRSAHYSIETSLHITVNCTIHAARQIDNLLSFLLVAAFRFLSFLLGTAFVSLPLMVAAEQFIRFLLAIVRPMSCIVVQAATASTPVMEISETDGNWTFKTSTTLKSMELKFK